MESSWEKYLESDSFNTESFPVEKESICLSFLVRRGWPKLGCFENNICTLSKFEVVPSMFYYGSEEDPRKCFTPFNENDCTNVKVAGRNKRKKKVKNDR